MKKLFVVVLYTVFSFFTITPLVIIVFETFSKHHPIFRAWLLMSLLIVVSIVLTIILNWIKKVLDVKPHEL